MRGPAVLAVVCFAVIVGLIVWAVKSDNEWNAKCDAAHGIKRQYGTTYVMSGKVLVPVAEYECVSQDGKVLFQ